MTTAGQLIYDNLVTANVKHHIPSVARGVIGTVLSNISTEDVYNSIELGFRKKCENESNNVNDIIFNDFWNKKFAMYWQFWPFQGTIKGFYDASDVYKFINRFISDRNRNLHNTRICNYRIIAYELIVSVMDQFWPQDFNPRVRALLLEDFKTVKDRAIIAAAPVANNAIQSIKESIRRKLLHKTDFRNSKTKLLIPLLLSIQVESQLFTELNNILDESNEIDIRSIQILKDIYIHQIIHLKGVTDPFIKNYLLRIGIIRTLSPGALYNCITQISQEESRWTQNINTDIENAIRAQASQQVQPEETLWMRINRLLTQLRNGSASALTELNRIVHDNPWIAMVVSSAIAAALAFAASRRRYGRTRALKLRKNRRTRKTN
jgi:hypothetical protein